MAVIWIMLNMMITGINTSCGFRPVTEEAKDSTNSEPGRICCRACMNQ